MLTRIYPNQLLLESKKKESKVDRIKAIQSFGFDQTDSDEWMQPALIYAAFLAVKSFTDKLGDPDLV